VNAWSYKGSMKKKKLYQILPFVMVGICVAGMCAVGVRIFAKKVMIGKLGIENIIESPCSPVVGCHVGPNAIGLGCFLKD